MILKTEILKQVFSEKFDGLIWKILIHEEKGYMAIESRQLELFKVFFTVLDIQTGTLNFKEKSIIESLNLNLAYAAQDNLILTANEHIESPESKGLISINIINGLVLWERYNFTLNQALASGLQVYDPKIYPRKYLWINHLYAENIHEHVNSSHRKSNLLFPGLIEANEVPNFIEHGQILGDISFLMINSLSILSFHQKVENNLHQKLIVYQDDRILLDDIIINNIQKLQPESFFISNNRLLYIRNKNEIVSYFV